MASEASFANDYRFTDLPEFVKRYETKVDSGFLTFSAATNIFENAYSRIPTSISVCAETEQYGPTITDEMRWKTRVNI